MEANAKSAQSDMKSMGNDAASLLSEAGSAAAEKAAELRSKSKVALDNTLSRAKEIQTSAIEGSKQIMRDTDTYVQKNPWRAISISAGIGILLGFIFSRRS
jgi:ElaB/YqjD/DUF883 family membrane-anchored ribosome-binding protein